MEVARRRTVLAGCGRLTGGRAAGLGRVGNQSDDVEEYPSGAAETNSWIAKVKKKSSRLGAVGLGGQQSSSSSRECRWFSERKDGFVRSFVIARTAQALDHLEMPKKAGALPLPSACWMYVLYVLFPLRVAFTLGFTLGGFFFYFQAGLHVCLPPRSRGTSGLLPHASSRWRPHFSEAIKRVPV